MSGKKPKPKVKRPTASLLLQSNGHKAHPTRLFALRITKQLDLLGLLSHLVSCQKTGELPSDTMQIYKEKAHPERCAKN
jgi:hypothetical protein